MVRGGAIQRHQCVQTRLGNTHNPPAQPHYHAYGVFVAYTQLQQGDVRGRICSRCRGASLSKCPVNRISQDVGAVFLGMRGAAGFPEPFHGIAVMRIQQPPGPQPIMARSV
jgi:hypothetical protein